MLEEGPINSWKVLIAEFVVNFCLSGTSAFSIFVSPWFIYITGETLCVDGGYTAV